MPSASVIVAVCSFFDLPFFAATPLFTGCGCGAELTVTEAEAELATLAAGAGGAPAVPDAGVGGGAAAAATCPKLSPGMGTAGTPLVFFTLVTLLHDNPDGIVV